MPAKVEKYEIVKVPVIEISSCNASPHIVTGHKNNKDVANLAQDVSRKNFINGHKTCSHLKTSGNSNPLLSVTFSDKDKSRKSLNRTKSKSLSSIRLGSAEDPFECKDMKVKKKTRPLWLPYLHLHSLHKSKTEETILLANEDSNNSTPLLMPNEQSGAPAVFLRAYTPGTSPQISPRGNQSQTILSPAFPEGDSENESNKDLLKNNPTLVRDINPDEEDSNSSGETGCVAIFKRKIKRQPPSQLGDLSPEYDPKRRLSFLSNLSISASSRRASLTSLLSLTPSLLSLAGRKFSFHLGPQRSDQMVSLSFKSIESYVSEDNLAGLKAFLTSRSVAIDDRDENGSTPLIYCASKGKDDFCKELLDHGADVHAEDNDQWNSLITAAKEGHHHAVQVLLEYGPHKEHKDVGGWTALMWACYKGHLEVVEILLRNGADANVQGQHHMTSLVWAAGRGHVGIVSALLNKGAKVNIGDKFGTTPLVWACRKGYLDVAEMLLKKGANVDATGMYSWTPLLVATKGNFQELAHLIIEHKPNVNALDKDGGTALTISCKEGYPEIASTLLMSGAYVNIQDRNGDTNLIYASRGGHRTVVELLLKRHADTDSVGKDKKTALYWAVEKGHTNVVKLLLSANADLEQATKEGDTALLRAVRSKNAEIVQLLIDKKARVTVADKKGDTALHIAMRGRSKKIVEILLRNPKNSQMLYRPNRAGEKPYNIDLSHQKTILGQIFGARRLNTNEENENMLGYDLYSSSMADILSEPSLSMPIAVGLYARWGSGKSFLIRKLKVEMNNFAHQWVEPLFQFTSLVFLIILVVSLLVGFIVMISSQMWYVGLITGAVLFSLCSLFLGAISYGSRSKYDWHLWYAWSTVIANQISSLKVVLQVMFCCPPGDQWKEWKDGVQAKPLKFIFAEGAKPTGTGPGANAVIQIVGSLYDMVEHQYGLFSTRFYRAFRPKPHGSSSPWKYRRLCGVPYIAIFFTTLFCGLMLTYLAVTYGFQVNTIPTQAVTDIPKPNGINKRSAELHRWNRHGPIVKRASRREDDDDFDDVDEDDENEEEDFSLSGQPTGINGVTVKSSRPLQGRLITPLLFFLSILISVVFVANIHTFARMVKSLMFSPRRHLMSSVMKFDTMNTESYLPTLKNEVNLLIDLVMCLDAFKVQQTRMVVILDGLDSCEQDKVLSVLDAVHTLFTDSNGPFIILLAIDPHIITKAIEMNATKVFRESSISGHDYLRNVIHLPFYLQNAGLRKVKLAEKASEHLKGRNQISWNEQETEFVSLATTSAMGGLHHIPSNRRLSTESGMSSSVRRNPSKSSKRLRPSDSVGSSIASNLNRVGAASDLNKVLLTDDYFNDINPRSMRRLMNVVYITGRLLKAFHIEFNWYHLALWVNITEQWPYRASWLIYFYEKNEDSLEAKTSLKEVYERARRKIPTIKEVTPLLEMDKDEKKLDVFLTMHENVLTISNLIIFLPFTINLDPYIKKVIKEDQIKLKEQLISPHSDARSSLTWDHHQKNNPMAWSPKRANNAMKHYAGSLPPQVTPYMWGYPPIIPTEMPNSQVPYQHYPPTYSNIMSDNCIPGEIKNTKLSSLSIKDIFEMFEKVEGIATHMLPKYKEKFSENNINGKVLLHCNLDDLKSVLKMTFGDWELFKMLVKALRSQEINEEPDNKSYLGHKTSNTSQYSFNEETSEVDSSEQNFARGQPRGSFSKDRDDQNYSNRKSNKNSHHVKQIAMEEQMIFGALQTLNEEAFEDVFEERSRSSLSQVELSGRTEEIDVVYIQSSPLLPHTVVSCASDCESVAPSMESSYSPYKSSISRGSSLRGLSTNVSPKQSVVEIEAPGVLISKIQNANATRGALSITNDLKRTRPTLGNAMRPQFIDLNLHEELDPDHLDSNQMTENEVTDEYTDLNKRAALSSLPDIFAFQNGPTQVSISEQISSSSSSSLERLKLITKRLQKALISSDNIDSEAITGDIESYPLVVVTPSPTKSEVTFAANATALMTNGHVVPDDQYISSQSIDHLPLMGSSLKHINLKSKSYSDTNL